jgi:hypothetical protein
MVFDYPSLSHERKHGPRGYRQYQSYKPWLRDEFSFRCIYCLCRERWFPDGDDNFGADHIESQRRVPERRTDYDNLAYACCRCNAAKQDCVWLPDLWEQPLASHLRVLEDGTIGGLTPEGAAWIQVCGLDRPKLTAFRKGLLALMRDLATREDPEATKLLRQCLAFPDNLPRLAALRPPGGNVRPDGISNSAFELQRRGELAATY